MKSRIVSIKNATWMKKGNTIASTKINTIQNGVVVPKVSSEEEEFQKLIAITPTEHKEKTVKILNQLFNEDISNQEAILLIENRSNCNMILRIKGETPYNLAVKSNGENSLVLKKGNYQLTSSICGIGFFSNKEIVKNTIVTLNQPYRKTLPIETQSQNSSNSSNQKVNAQK